ncbi:MAG: T9SS type A sorting domain-containing protein [Bacteroidetes bacterium]|nr:MAG: T9SS type A sorting domain-containing protein [Bacteroidota bacterium]
MELLIICLSILHLIRDLHNLKKKHIQGEPNMKQHFILLALLLSIIQIQAQPVPQNDTDTLWMRRTHDSYTLNFSPDSKYLMSWGDSPTIKIFETETGNIVNTIPAMRNPVFDLDNKHVYGNNNNFISKYDLDTKSITSSLDKESTDEYGFNDLSGDGKYFVATYQKGFKIWETNTGKLIKTKIFENESNLQDISFIHIRFNCDNSKIICAIKKEYTNPNGPDPIIWGGFIEFDINTLDSIRDLGNANDWVLSPNCNYIAYKYFLKDNGVRVFNLNSMELYRIINTNGPSITGMVFTSDEKYLIISHDGGGDRIEVWDLENNSIVYTYSTGGPISALGLSKDDRYLAASTYERLYMYKTFYNSVNENKNFINNINSYPNPTNSNIILEFSVIKSGNINIEFVNEIGQPLNPIKNEFYIEGDYSLNIDTQNIISGFYFIKFKQNNNTQLFKIQIVK